nr:hypothetical protein [Tanacetum cinerariifolium]
MEKNYKIKETKLSCSKLKTNRCLFELGKVGRACGSRGKWWSEAEMVESGARCLFELGKVGRAYGSRGKWWSEAEMVESGA